MTSEIETAPNPIALLILNDEKPLIFNRMVLHVERNGKLKVHTTRMWVSDFTELKFRKRKNHWFLRDRRELDMKKLASEVEKCECPPEEP